MEQTEKNETEKPNNQNDSSSSSSSPSIPSKKPSRSSSSSSSWSLDNNNSKKKKKNNDNSSSSGEEDNLNKKRNRSKSSSNDPEKSNLNSSSKVKANTVDISQYKSKITVPGFDGPLITESLFKDLQLNNIPNDVISEAYKDYKTKYENKKFQSFYSEHKNDEWFKEKYHPDIYYQIREEQNIQCHKLTSFFNDDINKFASINLTYDKSLSFKSVTFSYFDFEKETKIQNEIEPAKEESEKNQADSKNDNTKDDISNAPYFGFEPDKMTLFIHQLPRHISKLQVIEISKKVPGFVYLSLSEPIKNQDYNRYCWITFDSEENCNFAYNLLHDYKIANEYKLNPIKSVSITTKNVRITPKLFINRLEEDLQYTKEIIEILDKDKNIKNSPKFEIYEDKNVRLDLQILYLRKIHGCCYYCFDFYEDERNLSTKCDNTHLRSGYIGERETTKFENEEEKQNIIQYDQKLTQKAKDFIAKGAIIHPVQRINYEENEELQKLRSEYCKKNTITVSSERFRCNLCEKMFRGPNFVYNHIINKHMKFVKDMVDKNYSDEIKKQNYLNDSKKNYERIKVLNDMEEYLNYLNAMKKYQGYENSNKRNYHGNREGRENNSIIRESGRFNPRRHGCSTYRDYDDDKKNYNHMNMNQGRKLISYDDL